MAIRPATVLDAVAIIDLHFAAVHETARSLRAIAEGEELFVVAEDASGVTGFGSIVPTVQELRAVYVHPRAGRRGVGLRILRHLERLALDRGVPQLQMDASINAEAFYQRAGYEIVERGVHRLGSGHEMACVKMKKNLVKEAARSDSGQAV